MPTKGSQIYYISGPSRHRIGEVTFNGVPITWQSQPVYDTWGPNWIDGYWMCGEWMEWHKQLEAHYGREQANAIWYNAWFAQSALGGPQNCKWDSTFTNYLTSVGLLDPSEWAMILPNLANSAGNAAEAVNTLTGLIKPVAIIATIGLGFWAYKNYLK